MRCDALQLAWRGDGGKCGAVLVFLPGMGEIQKVFEHLTVSQGLTDSLKGGACVIHRLHSSVPSAEQQRAFHAVPVGTLKVILATNIAETSITFDDVVFVVDYGRQKVNTFDPASRIQSLQVWQPPSITTAFQCSSETAAGLLGVCCCCAAEEGQGWARACRRVFQAVLQRHRCR